MAKKKKKKSKLTKKKIRQIIAALGFVVYCPNEPIGKKLLGTYLTETAANTKKNSHNSTLNHNAIVIALGEFLLPAIEGFHRIREKE